MERNYCLRRRSPLVNSLLRDWEVAIAAGHVVNQYVFNEKLKVAPPPSPPPPAFPVFPHFPLTARTDTDTNTPILIVVLIVIHLYMYMHMETFAVYRIGGGDAIKIAFSSMSGSSVSLSTSIWVGISMISLHVRYSFKVHT